VIISEMRTVNVSRSTHSFSVMVWFNLQPSDVQASHSSQMNLQPSDVQASHSSQMMHPGTVCIYLLRNDEYACLIRVT
jgi:predicted lactoylglutathione lyase